MCGQAGRARLRSSASTWTGSVRPIPAWGLSSWFALSRRLPRLLWWTRGRIGPGCRWRVFRWRSRTMCRSRASRCGGGSRASPAGLQTHDHLVVARLRAAGAVVVGVTRMPELAIWAFTDGGFGMARNPWDLSRTCGGSSGGSAAAVAAALVPLAHGNDGLGSIRVPAAACGLVGIKPGFGLVPAELGGDNWSSMGENGPIATTVADAALGLSVMAGDPALARVDRPPGGLRLALVTGAPAPGSRVDRYWAGAARDVADLLAGQGHQVEQVQLPVPVWAWRALHARWFAGAEDGAAAAGLDRPAMEARTRRHARAGRIARRLGWVRLEDTGRWREVLAPFFARHDVVLGPALAAPPVPAIS